MGAECFTKGLPLQAKQRQPSLALAFSPDGHYGVKFCVFCMISFLSRFIYFVYSVRDFLAEISCEGKVFVKSDRSDLFLLFFFFLTALICFIIIFFFLTALMAFLHR